MWVGVLCERWASCPSLARGGRLDRGWPRAYVQYTSSSLWPVRLQHMRLLWLVLPTITLEASVLCAFARDGTCTHVRCVPPRGAAHVRFVASTTLLDVHSLWIVTCVGFDLFVIPPCLFVRLCETRLLCGVCGSVGESGNQRAARQCSDGILRCLCRPVCDSAVAEARAL